MLKISFLLRLEGDSDKLCGEALKSMWRKVSDLDLSYVIVSSRTSCNFGHQSSRSKIGLST